MAEYLDKRVCLYTQTHTLVSLYIYIWTSIRTHVNIHINLDSYTHVHIHPMCNKLRQYNLNPGTTHMVYISWQYSTPYIGLPRLAFACVSKEKLLSYMFLFVIWVAQSHDCAMSWSNTSYTYICIYIWLYIWILITCMYIIKCFSY